MQNLKALYDAAKDADAKVQRIMVQMLEAFGSGEDGKQQALALRPELDEAKQQADEANRLYISARDADSVDVNSSARKFVPTTSEGGKPVDRAMTRAEFESLSAADKMSFMLADGRIADEE